ncbi:YeeE/YedE family protein [Acetobacter sp.]|jgi:uncharacterized membrane protein YedE/YeeE|uniref:YeeE/YedE family protein n=1 Tax=Acetobacter sp. TaxID=440 RepID=UPI0025C4F79A|nr:YeeE/YedE family protein [Acetobacter sp.]MCH4091991.1 YeeE/YedE family protein [Acetobacter sp.]MCI1301089.1 YeeE/YedE family protein [Acetobacter sp.]MCI1317282.1 YeeE/YedE family protein [Acetobacter sp.]
MSWMHILQATGGGMMIGLSAAIFLLLDGRIVGISGILDGLLGPLDRTTQANIAFVAGLLVAVPLCCVVTGIWPSVHVVTPWPMLVLAGLLVGFGTRMGSGCTSGHGVCGLARLSPRSAAAVATFMLTAFITVFIVHHLGG